MQTLLQVGADPKGTQRPHIAIAIVSESLSESWIRRHLAELAIGRIPPPPARLRPGQMRQYTIEYVLVDPDDVGVVSALHVDWGYTCVLICYGDGRTERLHSDGVRTPFSYP